MTAQEIFNIAFINVIAQGCRSSTSDGSCKYRGPDGLKCAVGFMIDDETAAVWDTMGSIEDIVYTHRESLPSWVVDNRSLLNAIQGAHDGAGQPESFVESFTKAMTKIANRFQLEIPA